MIPEYECCTLCPRECRVNRNRGERGRCRSDGELKVARAALHMWEEPCITGSRGSGTIFFAGCSVGCVFCQNREIAGGDAGKIIPLSRLVEIFYELRDKGAHNINLVTGTHYLPQIVEAIGTAKRQGFPLPFVYNSSGYEKVSALKQLEGLIDIYLPDFKYAAPELAARYSSAPDYFDAAVPALEEMVRQTGEPKFSSDGLMKRGVIVRHLVLPGHTEDSREVIRYLYETYRDQIYISILNQFTPCGNLTQFPELDRTLTELEYDDVVDYAIELGVENGFIQEGETAKESFIPPFNLEGV